MTAKEFYKKKDVDLDKLPFKLANEISSFFLEKIYFSKEEIEKLLKKKVSE